MLGVLSAAPGGWLRPGGLVFPHRAGRAGAEQEASFDQLAREVRARGHCLTTDYYLTS